MVLKVVPFLSPRLALASLLAAGLALAPACSTQYDDSESSTSMATSSTSADSSSMTVRPAAPAMITSSATQDAGTTAEEQKQRAVIDALLRDGYKAEVAGQLEKAQSTYEKALAMRPGDLGIQNRIERMKRARGLTGDSFDQAKTQVEVIRQKQIAEVRDRLARAERFYELNEYKDAVEQLKPAQTLIRFDPYDTPFASLSGDVDQLLELSERRYDETKARKEREAIDMAHSELRAQEEAEQRAKIDQVKSMMIRGLQAFEDQDFDRSEKLASDVLGIAPTFRKAKDLRDFSRQARHAAWRKTWYKRRREQFTEWKLSMREAQIPWHHILQFPEQDKWDRLSRLRRNKGRAADIREDSERVTTLKNRLANETVTFDFGDLTIGEAVNNIRDAQNINIVMSKTAAEEKGEEPADLNVRDMNFGDALMTMLEGKELTYTFKHDMIFVVGKTESIGAVYPDVYEVRDLTIQLPNFVAPDLTLRPGPAGEEGASAVFGSEIDPTRETDPEQLLEIVRDNVAPSSWEIEDRDLSLSSGQLVATTTPEIHREIESFLEDLRQFTKIAVHVETRFISIREGSLNELGVDIRDGGGSNPGNIALLDDVTNGQDDNAGSGNGNNGPGLPAGASQSPGAGAFFNNNGETDFRGRTENIFNRALGQFLSNTGGASIGFTFLDDLELNVVFRAVEKSAFANVLRAPSLTIFNNQRANLTLVNQVTYVKDYDVEVAQTAFIADPLVDIIQDGLVLDVRPTVSHDRRYVTLELRPTVAILGRPIQTFVTPLAGLTTSVTIELPELQYRSASTTVKVPDRGHVVIGGLKNITTVDRRSETPILSQIPLLGFFFSKKGRSDELSDLLIVLSVEIIDLEEAVANLGS